MVDTNKFRLTYFDHQKGEKVINDSQELHKALNEMQKSASIPESINLFSPNGDILTVAVGADFGFVQFETESLDSPYLIAIDGQKKSQDGYRDVDAGGTPTPIPERACLPVEKVIEIVLYYFEHLAIPKHIEWEDV